MSAFAKLLDRGKSEAVPEVTPVGPPPPVLTAREGFWKEFLRVQCDKFILLALIIFLWKVGEHDQMKYVVGGLIVAINHNRFRWS